MQQTGNGRIGYSDGSTYTGALIKSPSDLLPQPHGQGEMIYRSGDSYNGQWYNNQYHGQGVYTYANGYANGDVYNGEFKDGRIFVDVKQKNPSTKKTVLFQSSQLKKAEDKQWGHGRFIDQNHLITRYNGIENANEVIAKLNELAEVNKGESTNLKLVFFQHGGKGGINDIHVNNDSAKQMLDILREKGYRDITVSDIACHGATGYHFKRISQEFVNTNPDINVTIRASVEGRTVFPCDSNNGTKFRTLCKDGEAVKRENDFYDAYDEGEGKNAGCLAQKLLKLKQRNQSTDYNRI